MGKLKDYLHWKKLAMLAVLPWIMALWSGFVCAASGTGVDIGTKVNSARDKIYTALKGIFLGAAVVVFGICALMLLIGTQKMKEGVKEHFYSIGAAFVVLFLAYTIVGELQSALE